MYRYETHLHTVESSKCGVTPGREYPAIFKERGYDGIFITDHFFHGNTRPDRDLPWPEYVDAYMKGYEEAKKAGDEIGFKVFFGIEENFEGDEYLIYGVGRDFLLAHPEIPHWTREEMTRWVHEAGGAVIQAHPFRDRFYISKIHLFPDGVEGIEGINTANTANDNLAALCYADAHGMLITAGSDTHDKAKIGDMNGGILYDTPIISEEDFANRLLLQERPKIFYPDALFEGMEGVRVKLPAEISRGGSWVKLSHEEIRKWILDAGAAADKAKSQPEGIVREIVNRLESGIKKQVPALDPRTGKYAASLAAMIRKETVSSYEEGQTAKFKEFRVLLKRLFHHIFTVCEMTEFDNGFVLRWPGQDAAKAPVLFMNHHDVVEVADGWSHGPFSGDTADEKLWGRGTSDDKGGLWEMLQAADEMAAEGFVPERDIWFSSSCTEETDGRGAKEIAAWFQEQNIHFEMGFDEGGMILHEPISGVHATFAMVGVGEKGCADLKFTARSKGGHASTPGKNTPLVRLGRFMAAVEDSHIFRTELSPAICEMFRRFAPYMGKAGIVMKQPEKFALLLKMIVPSLSATAAALLRTTVAFTMAQGSEGTNVLPQSAWVNGNMRYSHHQGQEGSFKAIEKLAKKYDIEMEIVDPGTPSRITDYNGTAFKLIERAVQAIFPDVKVSPYLMTGASDARFFDEVCDQFIRFLPFRIDELQMNSIHGIDENVDLDTLAPAVDWYRYMIKEV